MSSPDNSRAGCPEPSGGTVKIEVSVEINIIDQGNGVSKRGSWIRLNVMSKDLTG